MTFPFLRPAIRALVHMLAAAAACSTCGFYAVRSTAHTHMPQRNMHRVQCSAAVNIAVCTGSSCESRCNFNSVRVFEDLAGDSEIGVSEVRCMNMCKRGPAVWLVNDNAVATVEQRMSELEVRRTAFQNVASLERAEAIYGVAQAISDGSLQDAYGEFAVTQHGPLPPSAM